MFPAIVAEYVKPGQVKIDFRGLAFIGPDSEKALRIALAAGFQNKLWHVVELFYAEPGRGELRLGDRRARSTRSWPRSRARRRQGEGRREDSCRDEGDRRRSKPRRQALQVQGTPWFFIGFGLNQPYAFQPTSLTPGSFRPALDDALQG